MQRPSFERAVPERLPFRPRWWWDPVPEWLLEGLDKAVLIELGEIQVRAEIDVMQAQLAAAERVAEVLAKQR